MARVAMAVRARPHREDVPDRATDLRPLSLVR